MASWGNLSLAFFLSFSSLLCSMPTRLSTSVRRVCLILRSMGEEELSEGQTFTSMSQGLRPESRRMSKP